MTSVREVMSGRDEVASGRNEMTSGRDEVTSGRDEVTSGRDEVTSGQDVTSGRDEVTSGRDVVTSGRNEVTSGRDEVTSGRDESTSRRDKVTSGREVTSRRDEVTSGRDEVTSGRDELTSRRDRVTSGRDEVTSRREVTSRCDEVTSGREVTSRRDKVTSGRDEVTSRRDEVTSRRDDVTSGRDEVTSLSVYYGESGSGIGAHQLSMVLLTMLADMHVAACLFYFVFEASHQGWACADVTNGTRDVISNVTSSCCADREFSKAYTSPATEFNLVCERRSLAKLLTSAYFIGSILGSLLGGHLGDRYGRKRLALTMWTLMTVSMSMTSLARTWQLYAVLRFFTGVGGGPVSGSLMVLCSEYVGFRWRALLASQLGFSLGSLVVTLLTYLMSDNWRHLALTLALAFSPLILVSLWVMPESSRWLLTRGRVDAAHAQLSKLARYNKMAAPERKLLETIAERGKNLGVKKKHHSVVDLFRGKTMAQTTLIVLLCWLSASFVSFGLKSAISDITGNLYTKSIIGFAGAIPCRLLTILTTNTLGRRWCYVIVNTLVTVALVTVTVVENTAIATTYPMATSVVAMVGSAVSDGNWIVVNLFSTELYSTEIRNIAVGVVYMVSRTGASLAPFILLLDTFHQSIPYVIFASLLVLSLLLSLTLPETRNKPLLNMGETHNGGEPGGVTKDSRIGEKRVILGSRATISQWSLETSL